MNKYLKITLKTLLVVIYLFIIATLIVPLNKYVLYSPGGINNIGHELIIDNKENNNEFYSVYVIRKQGPTPFQILTAKLSNNVDLSTASTTDKDAFIQGQIQEEISYQNALINAYERASLIDNSITIDYHLKGYVLVYNINPVLKTGDIILTINNVDTNTYNQTELYDYLATIDTANVTIKRDKKIKEVVINKNDEGLFGISLLPFHKITSSNPTYQSFYEKDLKGGPSGGFMQTISIYSTLLNYKYNLKIAGTGTIELDGEIGPVGGVKQKIIAVNKKIDIFLCPVVHYEEALNAYKTIKNPTFKLIEVKDIDHAIEILFKYL